MSSAPDETASCVICGKEGSNKCSQCKQVHYCGRDHQKKDWKNHKKVCFPPGATCNRCQQKIIPGTQCQISHPEHLQQGQGSSYGPTGRSHSFSCNACSASYDKTSSNRECPLSEMPITNGPKWCYEGIHTIRPLADTDNRRICNDVVVIKAGPDIQEIINALDGNEAVRVLKIQSEGFYDEDSAPTLDISLPNLEELQTLDVGMGKINLTKELTPKVRKISMQNPTENEEPDFTMECPELVDFSCYYWGPGNFEWLIQMLQVATKLESFDSYKLRVGYLPFASNHLKRIRLHRAELLEQIDLWAPRLVSLDVQAAYDLEEIHFLKDHPLKQELPDNFSFRQELQVNAMNACLGQQAKAAIKAHPRFQGSLEDDEYDF